VAGPSSFTRKTPESLGISSRAILEFVTAIDASPLELHSFMILRHCAVAAEGWWAPHGPELKHLIFSLSKSFTSTAIGLAVQEGRLSVDDPVIWFFPDELPSEISSNLASMKVKHLLTMSTGHADEVTAQLRGSSDPNWVRTFLSFPVKYEPGTRFAYNNDATYMLSAMISKVTGQKLSDYLRPRLFEPLGIDDWSWNESPEGITIGWSDLSLRTEDIAKLGQLYLDKGVWRGRRILNEEWVIEASSRQISTGDGGDNDWTQGYGYQFWRCRHGAFRASGKQGQFCVIMPEQDAVVVITADVEDMAGPLNLVWNHLLPAMTSEVLPDDIAAQAALAQKLASLRIAT
jgi:CubicO group peptidase (beta-lactamase class C family)